MKASLDTFIPLFPFIYSIFIFQIRCKKIYSIKNTFKHIILLIFQFEKIIYHNITVINHKKRPPHSGGFHILWIVGRAAYPAYLLTTFTVACREPFPNLSNPLLTYSTYKFIIPPDKIYCQIYFLNLPLFIRLFSLASEISYKLDTNK